MEEQVLGLLIGGLFGAGLILGGLADPDKIIGTLRLKDFHAMRTIAVFVLVGMLGTWMLGQAGLAHPSVKPASLVAVTLGGALLGIGFGLTGYCPGTGLACAAAGRLDALVTVIGMFLGALVFILIHPWAVVPIDKILAKGKVTLPDYTGTKPWMWVAGFCGIGGLILWISGRFGKKAADSSATARP
ncbi:MAG: YeeE/YedE family protein [Sedimentisphaerales bacterium]|nr:YeeE/YedE family protein [Sedimentisphaerales bacterium]